MAPLSAILATPKESVGDVMGLLRLDRRDEAKAEHLRCPTTHDPCPPGSLRLVECVTYVVECVTYVDVVCGCVAGVARPARCCWRWTGRGWSCGPPGSS